MPTASNLVNQCGWKDNAFALTMSTVHNRKSKVTKVRKRPKKTSSKTKTARVPFGDQPTKELEIPELYNCYNHNILAINVADQLASSNSSRRRIKRGTWQALDQWLLITVLVNCYLVTFYSNIKRERQIKFRSQRDFRIQIIDALLAIGKDPPVPKKRRFAHNNYNKNKIPVIHHHRIKRSTRKDCAACREETYWARPLRRSPLASIKANQRQGSTKRSTIFGCKECNVALCKEGPCFDIYHRKDAI
jgi:hypothetical protein